MNGWLWVAFAAFVLWLVLWLALKITFVAIHLMLIAAVVLLIIGVARVYRSGG